MSTIEHSGTTATLPPLAAGQRMSRLDFHARYEEAPPHLKFELIEGVVTMASPLGMRHGQQHLRVSTWVGVYAINTPGVEEFDNASAALSETSEVQPDVSLRILPSRGGQSHDLGSIIGGAPEMVIEVADSSRRLDLGPKLRVYEAAGVLEYLVVAVEPFEILWHRRRDSQFARIEPEADGLYHSSTFPGLWLDPTALANGDGPALLAALGRGLAAPEHAAFVARLATAGPA